MATTKERLAALEAKLAALTATTPTEYYTHQYSGEEIDAAVGRALTGGALDTSVINVSNQLGTFVRPNLLDNWHFQIWQQYSNGSYSGVPNWIYVADRWIITSSNGAIKSKLTKATPYGGIKNATGPNCRITQRLENAAQFNGMKLTLSVLKNTGLYTATKVANGWNDTTDIFGNFRYETVWLDAGETILAAKLELGSTQTLAHREGGQWVLNEVPDYGDQLRRCQRYYQKFDENVTLFYGNSGSSGGAGARLFLPTAVQMRTKPVTNPFVINVMPEGTIESTNNITFTPSDVTVVPGGVCLYGAVSPSVSVGSYAYKAILAQLRNAPLALSADL